MSSKLMNCRFPKPEANVRLFCFPWAGGGSNFYSNWGKSVSDAVEIIGISLPGRESRFSEPAIESMDEVVDIVSKKLMSDYSDKPFAFFGHSMGALLAFETAMVLKDKYQKEPVKMYVSGFSAPHVTESKRAKVIKTLSDAEFIEFLRNLKGTPEEILNNSEMMKLFLPTLRADYSMVDEYSHRLTAGEPPLSCTIAGFDGTEDRKHDMDSWKYVTKGTFSLTMRNGGHFYLREQNNADYLQLLISRDFNIACG